MHVQPCPAWQSASFFTSPSLLSRGCEEACRLPSGTGLNMQKNSLVVPAQRRRIIFASVVGTTIEFFDFYIYATAAVSVFPLLFFPKGEGTAALLASMATFGVAFVARPFGSILFGHFGDRVGRKATLIGSLLLMGLATFAVGLLPTYHQDRIAGASSPCDFAFQSRTGARRELTSPCSARGRDPLSRESGRRRRCGLNSARPSASCWRMVSF